MKMQKIKSIIASFVCIVLIAAMALCITGCEKKGVDLKPFSVLVNHAEVEGGIALSEHI